MIRPFADSDAAAVYAIQSNCPEAAQWRADDYLQLGREKAGLLLVAQINPATQKEIAGFVAFYQIGDEAELRNLAIDPSQQRRGIGGALLSGGLQTLAGLGVRKVFLEVRSSNQPARRLYESVGFELSYTRRNYYQDPTDDALVLVRTLSGTPDIVSDQ